MVIIGKGSLEESVANPGLLVVKRLISRGIPVPICNMLSKKTGLGSKAGEKGLQVIDQA